ncbi:hypothetical protein QBC38DRAFT_483036 [Podospora fimiseda]|uniref:Uncharacterized protein n=1 Tax=Podospora fimiseda TaxID=252190 RepID=A0AAN7BLE4_9PEZI|nr:hypothetical protein QBC38DRAFT_483036 [Podospora fimiseda]
MAACLFSSSLLFQWISLLLMQSHNRREKPDTAANKIKIIMFKILFLLFALSDIQGALTAPSSSSSKQIVYQPMAFNVTLDSKQTRIGCTLGQINAGELQQAIECFMKWCRHNKIPPHDAKACTVGNSMFYACSYGGYNSCSPEEIMTAWGEIMRDCGENNGGWWFNADWKKTYGVDVAGAKYCGNL